MKIRKYLASMFYVMNRVSVIVGAWPEARAALLELAQTSPPVLTIYIALQDIYYRLKGKENNV